MMITEKEEEEEEEEEVAEDIKKRMGKEKGNEWCLRGAAVILSSHFDTGSVDDNSRGGMPMSRSGMLLGRIVKSAGALPQPPNCLLDSSSVPLSLPPSLPRLHTLRGGRWSGITRWILFHVHLNRLLLVASAVCGSLIGCWRSPDSSPLPQHLMESDPWIPDPIPDDGRFGVEMGGDDIGAARWHHRRRLPWPSSSSEMNADDDGDPDEIPAPRSLAGSITLVTMQSKPYWWDHK